MPGILTQMIAVTSVMVPPSARSCDSNHARKIADSVLEVGEIFQPIGVVPESESFRIVWGGHRLEAYRILDRKTIPARILPPGTTVEDEVKFSMLENNLRRDESFEDTLARVELLAKHLKCSIAKAAQIANVKPAYVSRCKAVSSKLCDEAKLFAKEHKLGISDLYLVATKATSSEMQLKAFKARVSGTSRDELANWFKNQLAKSPRTRKTKLVLNIDDTQIRLGIPEDTNYDRLGHILKQLHKKLFENKNIPIRLLQEVLK